MRLPAAVGALEERAFRLLWIGRTTSGVGDALVPVALAFAVLETSGSAGDLGIVLAAHTLAHVGFILVGGVWADRLERRRVMLAADALRAISQGALAAVLLAGAADLWIFVAASAVHGAAEGFFRPASTGLIPQTVSAPRLQQANALISLSDSATWLVGPAISGIVVAVWNPGIAFALDAASFVASAVALAALRVPHEPMAERSTFLVDLAAGLRVIRARAWLAAAFGTFAISNLMLATYQVLGPLVAARELGGAAQWGLILTGGAAGGIAGGAVALRWKPARPLAASFPLMLLSSLQLVLLLAAAPVPLLMAGNALSVFAIVSGNALWDTVLQQHVPRETLSRVSSVDWLISLVFMPLGFAAAGPLADGIGLDPTLALAAALGAAANVGVLAVPSVRRLRRLD